MLKLIQKSERVMANKKQLNQHGLKILDCFMKGRICIYIITRPGTRMFTRGIQNNEGGSRRSTCSRSACLASIFLLAHT